MTDMRELDPCYWWAMQKVNLGKGKGHVYEVRVRFDRGDPVFTSRSKDRVNAIASAVGQARKNKDLTTPASHA